MSQRKPEKRRPYQAPGLKRVELVPEEATLVACKNEGVFGPKVVGPQKCLPPASQCSHKAS